MFVMSSSFPRNETKSLILKSPRVFSDLQRKLITKIVILDAQYAHGIVNKILSLFFIEMHNVPSKGHFLYDVIMYH
jgi:hypothetical protein